MPPSRLRRAAGITALALALPLLATACRESYSAPTLSIQINKGEDDAVIISVAQDGGFGHHVTQRRISVTLSREYEHDHHGHLVKSGWRYYAYQFQVLHHGEGVGSGAEFTWHGLPRGARYRAEVTETALFKNRTPKGYEPLEYRADYTLWPDGAVTGGQTEEQNDGEQG